MSAIVWRGCRRSVRFARYAPAKPASNANRQWPTDWKASNRAAPGRIVRQTRVLDEGFSSPRPIEGPEAIQTVEGVPADTEPETTGVAWKTPSPLTFVAAVVVKLMETR